MSLEFYNPKSISPSVYIPCWLLQVPTKLLSNNAKIFYGRLAQWCNHTGDVFRSLKQLSFELGTPERTLERHLKELKKVNLIQTFHPQAGGINHYKFLRHEWMDIPINENLIYKNNDPIDPQKCGSHPPAKMRAPSRKNAVTPPAKVADINNKEIKEIKTTTTDTSSEPADRVVDVVVSSNPLKEKLQMSYRAKPFVTENIKNEDDFLSACDYSLKHRDKDITEQQRLRGILKLVSLGIFEEPKGWKSKKTNFDAEERMRLQEQASRRKWDEEQKIKQILFKEKKETSIPRLGCLLNAYLQN